MPLKFKIDDNVVDKVDRSGYVTFITKEYKRRAIYEVYISTDMLYSCYRSYELTKDKPVTIEDLL